MEVMADILEQELEEAFEVKSKKSLHRYVVLLTENLVKRDLYEKDQLGLRSDIRDLTEIVKRGFERMDERFEAMQIQMDQRFDAVDKRFEAMDKRFEGIQSSMDKRFEGIQSSMDKRFEAVDKRFEDMFHYVDKRFDGIDKKFNMMFTFMNIGMGIIILITILAKFLM